MSNSTIGELVFIELTFAKHLLYLISVEVNLLFLPCHVDIVHMLGCQQILLDLKLRVIRGGLESDLLGGLTELQRKRSRRVLRSCARLDALQTMNRLIEVFIAGQLP